MTTKRIPSVWHRLSELAKPNEHLQELDVQAKKLH